MTVYKVEAPDGKVLEIEAPEGSSEQDILSFAEQSYQPKTKSQKEERSAIEAGSDILASLGSGLGSTLQIPGQIGKLMGFYGPDEASTGIEGFGKSLQEKSEKSKSSGIKNRESRRAKAIEDSDGEVAKFGTFVKETITDPALISSFLFEQVPNLVGSMGSGLLVKGGVKLLMRNAAEQTLGRAGVAGAVGTGAVMQGADIGSDTYERVYTELEKAGIGAEEANRRALSAGRDAALKAAAISVGTSYLMPGGTTIEKAFLGKGLTKSGGFFKGVFSEGLQEGTEEGGGQYVSNLATSKEIPGTSLTEGIGQAAASGVVGGALFGGPAGVITGRRAVTPPKTTQEEQFVPPPPSTQLQSTPEEDALAVQQFVDQRYPAPPVSAPVPPAPVSLADTRLQKQQQATRQFDGLYSPVQDAGQQRAPIPAPQPLSDTNIPFPQIQAPPSGLTQDSFATPDEARIQKQQQAQSQFGLDRPIGAQIPEPVARTMAPVSDSQVPARQPLNITEQDRQASSLRVEQLGRQLDQATTDDERKDIRDQIDQALGVVQPTVQPKFVDLSPMDINQATGRLNVLRSNMADDGDNSLNLNVVPHPSVNGAFAIEQRPIDFDLNLPENPNLREQQNAEMAAEQDRLRQERNLQRAATEQEALDQSNQPPVAPNIEDAITALKVPPAIRSAAQVATVNQARARMSPEDFNVIQMEGQTPANMTLSDKVRLRAMRQDARFDLSGNFSPEANAAVDDIKNKLLPALKRLGLGNVGLKLVDSINNGDANGFYLKQLITIALDSDSPMGVMRHETVHALKELGAFTDGEWKALTKRAKAEWVDRFIGKDLTKRYQDVYSEQNDGDMSGFDEYIQEEAIAEAFRYFTENKPPAGMIQNIMSRLNKMFAAIRDFFAGKGLTSEDIFLTDAIFGSMESGRLTPGRNAERGNAAPVFSLNKNIRRAAEEIGLTEQELNATSLPLQTGKVGDERFKTPKIGLLKNVIQYLETRRLDSDVPILDVMKDSDHPMIAKLITAEAMAAIRSGGSALDWYDGVIRRTLNMAALKHPELATDQNAATAFKLAMAITSQGLNVEDNIKVADRVYTDYKKLNKFPLFGSGDSIAVMKKSFKRANAMIERMGMDDFRQFLETPYSVRDLTAATGEKISGELKDEMVLGSAVFGPKIGLGFYSNLNGNFEPVTMDMWFMRLIGRITGQLRSFDEKKVSKQLDRFRTSFTETGTNGIYANQFDEELVNKAKSDNDAAFELARLVNSAHERDYKNNRKLYTAKQRSKSDLVNSAATILNSLNKPIDSPKSGGQRRKLRQIFAQVRTNVAQLYGSDIPPAALQALVWYPEQSLYKNLGVKLRVTNQDYAGAMSNLLKQEGFDEQRIIAAAKLGSGPVRSGSSKNDGQADRRGSGQDSNAVPQGKFSLRPDQFAFRPSDSGREGISFQPRQPAAKSFVGSHYGNAKVNTLAGNKYGSGLKGAERRRLDQSNDRRIQNRVYFYIPRFNDTMPPREVGVGNFVYSQKLDNILPPGPVMSELFKRSQFDANAFESAIVDAGYDGYVNTDIGMMVVLNNDVPVQYEGTVTEINAKSSAPDKDARLSLRATETAPFKRWFGNSKILTPDGKPRVMYHGTARDITEFRPKQAGAIFVTDDPSFAESFADMSLEYMRKEYIRIIGKPEQVKLLKKALTAAVKDGTVRKDRAKDIRDILSEDYNDNQLTNLSYELMDYLDPMIEKELKSSANIMPVYIRAEKPFDYENPAHIEEFKQASIEDVSDNLASMMSTGNWALIERPEIQKTIRDAGFDAFYIKEGGRKNLALYSPNQVKSATGNSGTFSKDSDDIRYNLAESPNAPPQVLTRTTPRVTAGKAIVDNTLQTMSNMKENKYWEAKRSNWVDRYAGLTGDLTELPIHQLDGKLRGDQIKHAQSNVVNTVKNGLVSGLPFIALDGTVAIQPSENNLARSEFLADSLSINKNVVEAGMTGKNYVAEIARALRGEDILNEDKARNALGVRQLKEAKDLYAQIKKINATGGDLKLVKGYLRMIAKLRKEGYKNKKSNRERQVTPDQIRWAKEQLTKVPQVQEILDIWKVVNNSLIDLWQETGILTPDAAADYRNNKNYIPLFKSREDLDETLNNYGVNFSAARSSPSYGSGAKSTAKVKELKGSLATRNIWENVDKQYASMLVAAYENQSRRISFEQLESLGGATETTFAQDKNINLRFKRDGRDVHAIIDNPNIQVAFQTFSKELHPFFKFMGKGTQILRAGALINPMFWLKQLVRDSTHATLIARSGIVTPFHSGAEFMNIIMKNSPEAKFLATRGVIGQIDSTVSLNDFLKDVGREKLKKPTFIQNALHELLRIHEASDASTRTSVFKKAKAKALKDGFSEEMAIEIGVHKAREVMNFGIAGASPFLDAARQMIPFLNATIVGLDSLYKAASGYGMNEAERKKAMKVFRTNASAFFIMSFAYAFLMQSDDEYKDLPDHVKDNNFVIPIGSGKDKTFIRLPIPYEIGFLFKTLPEVFVRYLFSTSSGKEVAASVFGGILHNLPTGGVPIPQAIRPAGEVVANFSFFTMRPIEGMSDIYKPVEMRGERASQFAKILSGMGLSKLSLSPKQIDYLARGYFAELGTFATEMADYAIYAARGESPPPKNLEQQPFVRSFMTNPESSKAVSDFFEISGTAQQTVNGFNELKKTGSESDINKYVSDEKKAMTIAAAPTLRKIGNKMSSIKKAMAQIKVSDMPSDEKLRINNELFIAYKTLAKQGVDIGDQLGIR